MSQHIERAADWIYRGLWGVLAGWFKVPQEPPTLPAAPGEALRSFKPSRRFVAYRKFYFWLLLSIVDLAITAAWIVLLVRHPLVGGLLFPVYVAIAFVPDIFAYIAIHLQYDTTWYVLSERSMRIRRGVWIIQETTITYENIQNIGINQGPVERYFGIATLTVHTAGGGGGGAKAGKGGQAGMAGAHLGIIEGITDATELRDQLMARVERSRSAGLGDDHHLHAIAAPADGVMLGPEHLRLLAEIRDLIRGAPAPG